MARFFLSYARDNWEGAFLARFLDDLCQDLRQFMPGEEASFRDNEDTPLGAKWEPTLVEALHTCHAFVAVISPAYVKSDYCAKEWDAFSRRLERHAPDDAPPLILPVLWVPPSKDLPAAVKDIQYTIEHFGAEYAEKGLFTIIKNQSNYKAAYETFRERFRDALVGALNKYPLPDDPERPGFDELSNPFKGADSEPGEGSAPSGPNHVRIAVVAGCRKEMQPVRADTDCYGGDPREWAPFLDEDGLKRSLASRAQLVAALANLTSDFVDTDDLMKQIESARDTNHLVAMLVDAWSLKLPKYREKMRAYDETHQVNCAVLIPEAEPPPANEKEEAELSHAISTAFPTKLVMAPDPVSYRQGVLCADFDQVLRETLIKLQSRILRYREAVRQVPNAGPSERPGISGIA